LITGGLTYEDRTGGTMPGAVLPATGAPYREALNTRRYDLGGSMQWLARKRYVVTARAAGTLQQHDHTFGEVRERDRHAMVFGEVSVRGSAWRQTWVAGAATEYESYTPRDVPRFAYRYTTPGLFVQDDMEVAPWLSISGSGRVDFQSRYGTFWSPRISALVRWKGWTSRLSGGQGFFAPTPLTEETGAAGLTRLSVPRELVAERGRSASFDLSRTAGPVSTTVTLFGSEVRDPLRVERGTTYELTNSPSPTRNMGVELLGTYRKSGFSATATYSYVHARELEEGNRVDVPLVPHQSAGLTGMWEREKKWRIGLECYFTGRQALEENPYRSRSERYVSAGFLIERWIGPARLFLNAENLNDARQTRWNPLLRPARGMDGRWTVDAWAPLDGRVLNGGVRFVF
jgi:outer membrane receptor for ferrienterochelin and colicins